ncbi:uncharacterized protein METZ01_LOCUS118943 [marine metagenome]|uniref:RING-type domain-containing protein n=1 Tax=marine metagenome TaxID=408172 RepID=A0A381XMX9_9ZZZZ|tara:strand:+ start:5327 stop:5695 length:369 start_codon:yes stop_codon:yes gene_type:complete
MVVSGSAICIIGFSGVVLMIVTPKLKRGAQKINRYVKSVKKKNRYKKFIKSTKIVKCEEDCAICLDDYSENNKCSELYCGHKFHNNCFREWILEREVCPLCNQELTKKETFKDCYFKLKNKK